MINLAVLYIANSAPFLGMVQVIVYTGAVMMLFLFVLMVVGVDASDSSSRPSGASGLPAS
jgi:NADH-quinone oxidoreductase subunit J